jgi:tetratricopeptide (TPR) repeat protein
MNRNGCIRVKGRTMKPARLTLLLFLVTAASPCAFPQSSIKAAQDAYDSGSALRTQKDMQGASNALTRAIQLDPNFSDAWRLRGLIYRDLAQMKEAMADIERAIQLDPKNAKAYNARAIVKYAQGDYAGAITDSSRCIELDPGFSGAYMHRGNCRYQMKDLRGALADYDKAASVDPSNALVIYNRGLVHADLKEYGDAHADLKKSLEIDPNHAYAAQAKERLAKMPSGGSTLFKIVQAASAVMNLPETLKNPPPTQPPPTQTSTAPASPNRAPAAQTKTAPASAQSPIAQPPQPGKPVIEAEQVAKISMPKDPLDRAQWPSGDMLWEAAKIPPTR